MSKRELTIGAIAATAPPEKVTIPADVLTTHGVIVGMTGSGKTGLAIVLLEELARQKVPLVICDLKGDLADLLLTFPRLAPADFAPYLPASTPTDQREAAAQEAATRWRDGLTKWGLGEADITALRSALSWQLLTPGSGLAPLPGNAAELARAASKEFVREIAARPLGIKWQRALKLVQEAGEDDAQFRERCLEAAKAGTQEKAGQMRTRYETKLREINQKLGREELELSRDQQEVASRERQQTVTMAAGVGDALFQGLGALLGGRRSRWRSRTSRRRCSRRSSCSTSRPSGSPTRSSRCR